MKPVLIAPSILAADYTRLGEQVRAAEEAGVDSLHCDMMDGHFVPPITFGPLIIEAVRRAATLPLDIHLMVEHPESYIEPLKAAGATGMTVHVEATRHLNRVLGLIKDAGMQAGVALNPATPAAMVEEVLHLADLILVMSINPGWGGQPFMPDTLPKLRRIRAMIDERGLDTRIQIDGGITEKTAPLAVEAGADILVAGTAVFNEKESVEAAVRRLRAAIAPVEPA